MDCLSLENATCLGFPSFHLTTRVFGRSWDASVYDGLRQFHQAKGFDPESQDIARHLGLPLYQLTSDSDAQFTCVDGEDDLEEVYELPALHEESPELSKTFKFLMNVQLVLILFLALSCMYPHI
ncbi:hypothetical protein B0H12DRAFT_1059810 [Mycena haematopus]|nr:hypothetical protein B0H12DRAFT_1059810 [Mycena haematopus]